jgi:hypothetical protein
VLPFDTPDTIPVPDIVAIDTSLLDHVPPAGVDVCDIVDPTHNADAPVIVVGKALTVSTELIKHPDGTVYIIVDVPAATEVAIPVPASIVAVAVLELVQLPPAVPLASAVVLAGHIDKVPDIANGRAFTVTTAVVIQAPTL